MAQPKDQQTTKTFSGSRIKCAQCGKDIRHLPFASGNVICRECYGVDRYQRGKFMTASNQSNNKVVA